MIDMEVYGKDKPCEKCEYRRTVIATGQWKFHGCYHEPYRGKRCSEIKRCPKEEERMCK